MNGINKAIIVGYVGQDPKIQSFSNGGKAANFTVATTERGYTTKSGRQVAEQTEWHNVVCYGSLAGVVERYIRKGTPVYVEGKLHTRIYDGRDGAKHYVTEINVDTLQMLGSRQEQQQQPQQPYQQQGAPAAQPQSANNIPQETGGKEDDLPF